MSLLVLHDILESNDGITSKFIFDTEDGFKTEGVYVNYINKHIVCYSTQIGCSSGCKFCYNGINKSKFRRNLTSHEIFYLCDEILRLSKYSKDTSCKPILFSAMGIGDPLNNYDEWSKAIKKLYEKYPDAKYALSSCFSVPGCGFTNLLTLLSSEISEIDLKLQISIHTPFNMQRKELMPNAGNLDTTLQLSNIYQDGHKLEFNYILIDGVNDTEFHAMALAEKMYKNDLQNIIIKVNKFNKVFGLDYEPSKPENINKFIDILKRAGLKYECYETDGTDINAACGQMGYNE